MILRLYRITVNDPHICYIHLIRLLHIELLCRCPLYIRKDNDKHRLVEIKGSFLFYGLSKSTGVSRTAISFCYVYILIAYHL